MTESVFFKSAEHKSRFVAAMQQTGKASGGKLDQEYSAAVYILTADSGTWNKAGGYVDREGIDFEALLKEVDFSGGYGVLIMLAGNLFNGNQHIDPLEFLRLDDTNFKVALNAIELRRHSYPLSAFQ